MLVCSRSTFCGTCAQYSRFEAKVFGKVAQHPPGLALFMRTFRRRDPDGSAQVGVDSVTCHHYFL